MNPNGVRPNWDQMGPGPNGPNGAGPKWAQMGPSPNGARPKWSPNKKKTIISKVANPSI